MKHFKLFLIVLLGITIFGCKKEEKESVANEQEKMQQAFNENLSSYSSNPKELVKEGLEVGNYALVVFVKGDKISYQLNSKKYEGVLERKVFFLKKNQEKFKMKNGAILIDSNVQNPTEVFFSFQKIPKDRVWEFKELNNIAQNYPLTIVQLETFWQNLVKDYEEFSDLGKGEIYYNPPPKFKVLGEPFVLTIGHYVVLYDKNKNELPVR